MILSAFFRWFFPRRWGVFFAFMHWSVHSWGLQWKHLQLSWALFLLSSLLSVRLSFLWYADLQILTSLASLFLRYFFSSSGACPTQPWLYLSKAQPGWILTGTANAGNHRIPLICFLSLGDCCPVLGVVQFLKTYVSYILSTFNCLKWDDYFGTYYSIMAGRRILT